jgi:hypothetical protein
MNQEKFPNPDGTDIHSIIQERQGSKLAKVLTELCEKDDIFIAGVIVVWNPFEKWFPETASVIVSPRQPLTEVESLNNLMFQLVQVEPDQKKHFVSYGTRVKNEKIILGNLTYYDRDINNDFYRRTWLRLYPNRVSAVRQASYEYRIAQSIMDQSIFPPKSTIYEESRRYMSIGQIKTTSNLSLEETLSKDYEIYRSGIIVEMRE